MATTYTQGHMDINLPYDNTYEPLYENLPIRGKLITVELKVDDTVTQILSEAQIKADIAHKLAEQLLKENVINFTKQHEANMYTCTFRGYLYVTPSGETEIIRKYVKGTL